jgi:carbon monoxide dehydrogenase subunit G
MAEYRFLTTWVVEAPREAVWEAIYHPERWPEWWPGVVRVDKLGGGAEDGVGSTFRHRWRSVLPYTVEFETLTTRVDLPDMIEAEASGGLAGTGRWRFFAGAATAVTYEWNVHTTKRWMNGLAPVGRPLFEWNHNWIMGRGGEGLARLLGTRLLARS